MQVTHLILLFEKNAYSVSSAKGQYQELKLYNIQTFRIPVIYGTELIASIKHVAVYWTLGRMSAVPVDIFGAGPYYFQEFRYYWYRKRKIEHG